MTSSYNTGSTGSATGPVSSATGETLVLPSGILVGDQLLVFAGVFTWSDAVITAITCTATSGHTWTPVGTLQNSGTVSGLQYATIVFTRTATSGDASDTLVFNMTGTPPSENQLWWTSAAAAYTGFPGGVDTSAKAATDTNENSPIIYPTATTGADGCWAICMGPGAINSGGDVDLTINGGAPIGLTLRNHHSNSGITTSISDSNGSVGTSGTSIGGGSGQAVTNGSCGWTGKFTISLSPVSTGVSGTGSIRMHKMGIAASGHAPVVGTGSIRMHKMAVSIQAHIPGTAAVRMHKMGISASGHAPLQGTGSIRMHKMGIAAAGSIGSILAVFNNTDGNGVDTYDVTCVFNGPGTTTLRVLNPVSPAAGYSHIFLYTLAVEVEGGSTFGNGLDHVRSLGANDAYNITVVEPSFKIDPWFADHPTNPDYRYETYMIKLVDWVKTNLETTGQELHVLIGFSKSGIGGQGLILNNPTVFDKCISWDFPADMTSTARFDPDSTANYGPDPAFANRYELDSTSLAGKKTPFLATNRLYIDGGTSYTSEVTDYDGRLTAQSMLHTYPTPVTRSHAWDSGWVAPALADVMAAQSSGTGSIRMHKMGLSVVGTAPLQGTGSIRMKKMRLSVSGTVTAKGTGSIRMHKMRVFTPNFSSHVSSELFVFTDV